MNFGENLYNWLAGNLQPIVLLAIVAMGVVLVWKRQFSALIGWAICSVIAVGLVFNAAGAKDFLLQVFNKVLGIG